MYVCVCIGQYLEALAMGKTSEALTKLLSLRSNTAVLIETDSDGTVTSEKEVDVDDVKRGDIVKVLVVNTHTYTYIHSTHTHHTHHTHSIHTHIHTHAHTHIHTLTTFISLIYTHTFKHTLHTHTHAHHTSHTHTHTHIRHTCTH